MISTLPYQHWVRRRLSPPDAPLFLYQCPVCLRYQDQIGDGGRTPVPELDAWRLLAEHLVEEHVDETAP